MISSLVLRRAPVLAALALASACTIVDSDALDALQAGVAPSNTCGDRMLGQLTGGPEEASLAIDTRGFTDTVRENCEIASGPTTPGNDVFFRFTATRGEYWHFHLKPDDPTRNPLMYVFQELDGAQACNTRSCLVLQNACGEVERDEHFGFFPPSAGSYYLGIDDGKPGGSTYTLSVYRPICGMNGAEHGERCDTGDPQNDRDGCDPECRRELPGPLATTIENNGTRGEAFVLELDAPGAIVVDGSADVGCAYPSYFAVEVPAGDTIAATGLNADGTPCTDGSQLNYRLEIEDFGGRIYPGDTDANGCPFATKTNAAAGEWYVRVLAGTERSVAPYDVEIRVE